MSDLVDRIHSIRELRRQLHRDPTNLNLIMDIWNEMGRGDINMQDSVELVRLFREAALSSVRGVVELSKAFKELRDLTGDSPRSDLFDPDLRKAIFAFAETVDDKDVAWLVRCLGG